MKLLKTTALLFSTGIFSLCSVAQTATKTTTTTKTVTTPAKTSTTTVKSSATTTKKAPQTITKKTTTTKKTTPAKQLQRPATVKTDTIKTSQKTTTEAKPILIKPVAVIIKTEPQIIIPKPGTQTNNPPAAPQQNTSGKINTGGGNNTTPQQNTNTNTGGKVVIGGGTDNNSNNNNSVINDITNGDATSAIKEALMKGVQVGVDKVSVTDGYLGNSMIKIPFPSEVSQVESALRNFGMGSLVDNAVTAMNRAAESAASQAGPIFLNGIKQMNVTDAVNIVSNKQPDAATQFLKRTTTESLVSAFKPSIKTALDKTLATKYWGDITNYYNKIPFVSPIDTDLPDYVTRKAIDGLFYMVAQEEAKIRKDPAGQANEIIKTVFGKVKF